MDKEGKKDSYIFICDDCGDEFNGETDCLKHADRYAHHHFKHPDGGNYNPHEDEELIT